jgi:hypothetical protein
MSWAAFPSRTKDVVVFATECRSGGSGKALEDRSLTPARFCLPWMNPPAGPLRRMR